jgi:ankyrin repeat protein
MRPLSAAVAKGHEGMVAYLLDEGLESDIKAIKCCARYGSIKTLEMLLGRMKGQGLDHRDSFDGSTALHEAVNNRNCDVLRALLMAGADPSIVDNRGRTPRALAQDRSRTRQMDVFKVSRRADVWVTVTSK